MVDIKTKSSCKKSFRLVYRLSQGMWFSRILTIVAPIFTAIHFIIFPFLMKKFIDNLFPAIEGKNGKNVWLWAATNLSWWTFLLVITALQKKVVLGNAIPRMKLRLEENLLKKLLKEDAQYYQKNPPATATGILLAASGKIRPFLDLIFGSMLRNILIFFVSIPGLVGVSWLAVWCSVLWMAFFSYIAVTYANKIYKSSLEQAKVQSDSSGQLSDTLKGIETIRFFNTAHYEASRGSKVLKTAAKAAVKTEDLFSELWNIYSISFFIYFIVTIALMTNAAGLRMISSTQFLISFQLLTLTGIFWWNFISDFVAFPGIISDLSKAVDKIEEQRPRVFEAFDAKPLQVKEGSIEFKNISFSYPNTQSPLIEELSLTIKPKEKVAVVGQSLSGKTTLIDLLLRKFDPDEGQVLIDGQDISKVTLKSLRQSISVIEQAPAIFSRSIFENIRYGSPDATFDDVKRAAQISRANIFIEALPNGYETIIGQGHTAISSDQRQRIAIARAVLKNSPIILSDEATTHLDPIIENDIRQSIKELVASRTLIFIVHKLSAVKAMDRILVFKDGKVIQDGTHDTLEKKAGLYQELLKAQINEQK